MEIARDGSLITFYVDVKDQVTLICPKCHKKKSIDATKFKNAKTALKVDCPCGEEFRCIFEFRKFYRKRVSLRGVYTNIKTGEKGEVTVDSISLEGVGFMAESGHSIEPGQILTIDFILDNKMSTPVERTIKITSVRGNSIGAMFFGSARNKTVGFYLMP